MPSSSPTKRETLTDAAIRRYSDDAFVTQLSEPVTGLVFRYSKSNRKRGSFHLRHYQNGQERWVFVARWPAVSVRQAREIYRQMKPVLFLSPDTPAVLDRFDTVGQVLDWHNERTQRHTQTSKGRKAAISSSIGKHLKPLLGDVLITDLTHSLLDEKLFQGMADLSPGHIRAVFGVLKTALKLAHIFKLLTSDPMKNYSYKDFNTAKVRPKLPNLTQKELKGVIESLPYSGRTRLLMQLMLMWGTRIGETVALRWSWIDWEQDVVRIPASATKTGKQLDIPLTRQARSLLVAHLRRQTGKKAFVFPGKPAKSLDVSTFHKELAAISKGAWTSHDLRKLACTIWGDLGVEFAIRESLLNHVVSGLDVIYNASQLMTKKREALTLHADHLDEAGLFH